LRRPVQPERSSEKHCHLATRDWCIRTVISVSAAPGDSGCVQRFDEAVEWMSNGHVGERRCRGIGADLQFVVDARGLEINSPCRVAIVRKLKKISIRCVIYGQGWRNIDSKECATRRWANAAGNNRRVRTSKRRHRTDSNVSRELSGGREITTFDL